MGKGKGGKKGKKSKGPKCKWGDEDSIVAKGDEQHEVKKRAHSETQEAQDRERRFRISQLQKRRTREVQARLRTQVKVPIQPKKKRARIRPRQPSSNRPIRYESDEEEEQSGINDTGVDIHTSTKKQDSKSTAAYKLLLQSLRSSGSAGIEEDRALALRKMEEEGGDMLDDSSETNSDSGRSDSGSEDGEDSEHENEHEEGSELDEMSEVEEAPRSEGDSDGGVDVNDYMNGDEYEYGGEMDEEQDYEDEIVSNATDSDVEGGALNSQSQGNNYASHFASDIAPISESALTSLLSISAKGPKFRPIAKQPSKNTSSNMKDRIHNSSTGWSICAQELAPYNFNCETAPPPEGVLLTSSTSSLRCDVPAPPITSDALISASSLSSFGVGDGLVRTVKRSGGLSTLQKVAVPILTQYSDLLFTGVSRILPTSQLDSATSESEEAQLRKAYLIHVINHTLKARRRVARHDAKLKKMTAKTSAAAKTAPTPALSRKAQKKADKLRTAALDNTSSSVLHQDTNGLSNGYSNGHGSRNVLEEQDDQEWMRDQGYTRPKVLIVCPMRHQAYDIVTGMRALLGDASVFFNWERFEEEYGPTEDNSDDEDEEGNGRTSAKAKAKRQRDKLISSQKPNDWQVLFGSGKNCDDEFKFGISVQPRGGQGAKEQEDAEASRGASVRLFSDFYHSDIIIASPLGLHLATTTTNVNEDDSDVENDDSGAVADCDFLSSIEVCVVDGADVMLMQNWQHLVGTLSLVNTPPKKDRGIDFSRVWKHIVHGQSRLWRQTIVLSAVSDPAISALVRTQFRCRAGAVRVSREYKDGSICNVAATVRQVFQRVLCLSGTSPSAQDDVRFEHFKSVVLPALLTANHGQCQPHTVLFIPSYYDYVRVRNELLRREQTPGKSQSLAATSSAVFVCEYSRTTETARARARFFQGLKPLLVYTGRAHFFNRYRLRGMRHLVIYGVPTHPEIYPELVNLLEEGSSEGSVSCLTLFTPFEKMALSRVVGTERAERMIGGSKHTFLFE